MSNDLLIPDRMARESAETTFDRNVVVVAGAGTGKTTLLVNRLVYLLMKEPAPVLITQVVALTFTNKAATEMKVRLRERLVVLARPEADSVRSRRRRGCLREICEIAMDSALMRLPRVLRQHSTISKRPRSALFIVSPHTCCDSTRWRAESILISRKTTAYDLKNSSLQRGIAGSTRN